MGARGQKKYSNRCKITGFTGFTSKMKCFRKPTSEFLEFTSKMRCLGGKGGGRADGRGRAGGGILFSEVANSAVD